MLKSLIKHSSRCVSRVVGDMAIMLKREISVVEFGKRSIGHFRAAWTEAFRPPATEAHKRAILHLNRGIRYYNDKQYATAVAEFEEAIACDPKYGRAHLYYGNAKYKLHDTEEALAAWRFVLRTDPYSEAAEKAQQKLDHLQSRTEKAIRDVESYMNQS